MRAANRAPVVLIFTALAGLGAFGQARSGLYGNLTVGVNGMTVTGAFSDARVGNGTEDAPQFSCLFLLRGTLNGSATTVTVWSPFGGTVGAQLGGVQKDTHETSNLQTSGSLAFEKDTAKLHLEANPPGCAATGDDFVALAYEEPSVMNGKWTSVRLVSAETADVLQAPVDGSSRKTRLSKGNVVVIYRRIGAWLEGQDLNASRPVRGWLRSSDLAPDSP